MKAPEIIYINGFSAFATEPVKDGVQYIRKDALLEWANELKEKRLMGYIMFDELLEKIESL